MSGQVSKRELLRRRCARYVTREIRRLWPELGRLFRVRRIKIPLAVSVAGRDRDDVLSPLGLSGFWQPARIVIRPGAAAGANLRGLVRHELLHAFLSLHDLAGRSEHCRKFMFACRETGIAGPEDCTHASCERNRRAEAAVRRRRGGRALG